MQDHTQNPADKRSDCQGAVNPDAVSPDPVNPDAVTRVLTTLRRLDVLGAPRDVWTHLDSHIERHDWPVLFHLLDIGADLPRLRGNRTLDNLAPEPWPALAEVSDDLVRIQALVDHPEVPRTARLTPSHGVAELETARQELIQSHCTTFEDLLEPEQKQRLSAAVDALRPERVGTWAQVEPGQAPELEALVREGLGSEAFATLTGFELARGEFTITLSLQDLQTQGIGWHRDLYWPEAWVGQDVFALFYALGSDSPAKGGAFVSYHLEDNEIRAFYRQEHSATILWNGRRTEDRPFHAVAGYHGEDTARHLLIVQCLRP